MSDRIVQAIATLVRASYADKPPTDRERDQWRAVAHAASLQLDRLRATEERVAALDPFVQEIAKWLCECEAWWNEDHRCNPCRARALAAPGEAEDGNS